MNDERDPTKLGSVAEEQLRLKRELTRALPTGTREDIEALQEGLQRAPQQAQAAAVEQIRSLPDQKVQTVQTLKEQLQAAPNATAENVPLSAPPAATGAQGQSTPTAGDGIALPLLVSIRDERDNTLVTSFALQYGGPIPAVGEVVALTGERAGRYVVTRREFSYNTRAPAGQCEIVLVSKPAQLGSASG